MYVHSSTYSCTAIFTIIPQSLPTIEGRSVDVCVSASSQVTVTTNISVILNSEVVTPIPVNLVGECTHSG